MLRLALVALACARALALPTAPGNALAPHDDLERNTHGPKCCKCDPEGAGYRQSLAGCRKQAQCTKVKHPVRDLVDKVLVPGLRHHKEKGCEKETCATTCKDYGGAAWYGNRNGRIFHYDCRHYTYAADGGLPATDENFCRGADKLGLVRRNSVAPEVPFRGR